MFSAFLRDQHIGEHRKCVSAFNNSCNRLKRLEDGVSCGLDCLHCNSYIYNLLLMLYTDRICGQTGNIQSIQILGRSTTDGQRRVAQLEQFRTSCGKPKVVRKLFECRAQF